MANFWAGTGRAAVTHIGGVQCASSLCVVVICIQQRSQTEQLHLSHRARRDGSDRFCIRNSAPTRASCTSLCCRCTQRKIFEFLRQLPGTKWSVSSIAAPGALDACMQACCAHARAVTKRLHDALCCEAEGRVVPRWRCQSAARPVLWRKRSGGL